MRARLLGLGLAALLLGGCALPTMPGWMPWLGKASESSRVAATAKTPKADTVDSPRPGDVRERSVEPSDDSVSDRIIAVVNNDAITLAELQESVVSYRQENPGARSGPSDEELRRDFLNRLIDNRLQLQEADREKITVEEHEVAEEINERIKVYNTKSVEEFEKLLKEQGITMDAVKKRVREALRVQKIIRRKVALRVSVTDAEIIQYLEENRQRLETGLSYHARHILVVPEGTNDVGWESARIKAEMLRAQVLDTGDFIGVAKQYSQDASAKDGGDLGTLRRGELAQDIETEILRLEPGQLSAPYRSSLGYHVFKLESKESLEGAGLFRVKQQIREILFRQKYEARLEAWLKEIKQRAIIEVRM
jgi:peptidyl-prolyl cis-trans isomerase SurA